MGTQLRTRHAAIARAAPRTHSRGRRGSVQEHGGISLRRDWGKELFLGGGIDLELEEVGGRKTEETLG